MDRVAKLSLSNRSFIALLTVVVAILGAMSMLNLRQELIPSVSLPQVQIITTVPGSTTSQVRAEVSQPIEDAVKGLENVEGTTSTSQSSLSIVAVELTYGTDVARSSNQVEAALNRIEDQLPELADTQVLAGGSSDIPAMILAVSSDLEPADLGQRLDSSIVPEIRRVDGVASVVVAGAPDRRVVIAPDEAALAERGMSTQTITEALDKNGLALPGGTITDEGRSLNVNLGKRIDSVESLRDITLLPPEGATPQIGANGLPEVTRLSDVAQVDEVVEDAEAVSRTNGRESLVMLITPTADGNVVSISEEVSAELDSLLDQVGGNASYDVVFDQAPFIQTSIASLAEEGLLGLVFAVLVILLFLRAMRPTIVTAISIPLSLLIAFLGMLVSGYTLNLLTLAALTISIGRVVDDSIVVIENIMRHMQYGKSRLRAVLDGTREVVGAITASTVATVLVFLPVAVVSGLAGELFRPFALTTAIALLASLFVAITIVPVLAYWFLRPKKEFRDVDPDDEQQVAQVKATAEAQEERTLTHRLYAPTLAWSQAHRVLTLVIAGVILLGTVALTPLLKINFLGDTGQNFASYTQTLPAGTSLEESTEVAAQAEDKLLAIEGVDVVQTTIGASQFGFGGSPEEISYQVTTDPDADQAPLLEEMLAALEGMDVDADVEDQTSGGAALGSSTVDIRVTGPTPEARQETVDALLAELDPLPEGVAEVASDLQAESPTAQVTVDREAAAQRGLNEEAVVGLVASRMFPSPIDSVTIGDRELSIYLEQGETPQTLQELRDLEIAGGPLTDIASVEEVNERSQILTRDAQETVTISLTPEGNDTRPATDAAEAAIAAVDLPDGAQATLAGTAEDITDSFTQLGIAMFAAIMLTYVMLVWILKSLKQPLVLLISIPFAATGALGLLVITGQPLGLPAMIGLLMLIGVVVTNAIVLIDLINQYRRQGMGLDDAIREGAHKRLRPILMTAAATIFALLPMAFGITGQGGFIAQPMAIVVIGGLITSTLLTLLIVPVLYRLTEAPGEKRRQLELEAEREREAERRRRAHERERRAAHRAAFTGGATAEAGRRRGLIPYLASRFGRGKNSPAGSSDGTAARASGRAGTGGATAGAVAAAGAVATAGAVASGKAQTSHTTLVSDPKGSLSVTRENDRDPSVQGAVETTENGARTRDASKPGIGMRLIVPIALVLVWLTVFAFGGMSFGKISEVATNDRAAFLPASSESTQVQDLQSEFLGSEAIPAIILLERTDGVTEADTAALTDLGERAPEIIGEGAEASPVIPSEDGEAAQLIVTIPEDIDAGDGVELLQEELATTVDGLDDGAQAWVTGPAGFTADLAAAFGGIDGILLLVTLAVVLVILVVVYRSPLLPIIVLLSSLTALCAAILINVFLAEQGWVTINGQVQGILFILVIGAATDYSLLYIARYREELRDYESPVKAALKAVRGTLEPIIASGGTVIVGLMCLLLSDLVSNSALGPVASVGIVMSILTSLTFLPAMLALVGRAAFWPRAPKFGSEHPQLTGPDAKGLWPAIGRFIQRAPKRIGAAVLIFLVVGCIGLVKLDASGVPQSEFVLGESQARDGQEAIDRHFAGGSGSPTYVVAPAENRDDIAQRILAIEGVDSATLQAQDSPSGTIPLDENGQVVAQGPFAGIEPTEVDGKVMFDVTLSDPADSRAAEETVVKLRDELAGEDALVGGTTAIDLDTNTTSAQDRNLIIPIVLAAITVMLAVLLRSLVAPLLLLATTVLSFGTALGISAVIFTLLGQTASDPSVPLYGFVFLVALGIDYNIFLMTRVREESLVHGTREGTLRALSLTGGVITSAGIVLAATFAALAVIPIQFLLQLAIIVSLGVLIDALIVRSFLVPAMAEIFGDKIWWPAKVPKTKKSDA